MKHLEHIGIAVKDLDAAEKLFTQLLGVAPYKREEVESEGVITSFFLVGNVKIELLAATKPESAIYKFIEKKGEGIHHLAFAVEQIEEKMVALQTAGFDLINTEPKAGADNKKIAFLHPKSTVGVLMELCEDR